jgi:ABC-2 type transport system ATP-binding protein
MVGACRGLIALGASLVAVAGCSTLAYARDTVVTSFDGTPILTHFYPATSLLPEERVPTVLVGPPWAAPGYAAPEQNGGDRIGVARLLADGFNVVTWDPRGFGRSGGTATFDSAAFEGRDVQALVDFVAAQPEALLDAPGDPRIGMSGSSYGGGIQFVAAGIDSRLDAIVPDVAWHSLVTGFERDNAFKAGWLLPICVNGLIFGLLDGVTGVATGPAGLQLGSVDSAFLTMCLEGNALGALSGASTQWLADRGPGALLAQIHAPTLLTHGTVDTLFPLGEAIANYNVLRNHGVPVKMLWYCGGHGTCTTPAGDPAVLGNAGLTWLRRWLKRDPTIDTGPPFEWIDDTGTWRSGPDYPLAAAGALTAYGSGVLTLLPSLSVTLGPMAPATPSASAAEIRYPPPAVASDIVGKPTLTLTYSGFALPAPTFVYAQVVDAAAHRVVGGQVTPIPVVLDGRLRTVTRKLEAVAVRGRPTSDLRLQLVPSTTLYTGQRSIGTLQMTTVTSSLPLVDATRSGR